MNITFLIGNGFDVGMGLRTKFKDFYPIYVAKSQKKKERIKKLADKIEADGEEYKTWADFETAMGIYTEEFTPKTKQDYLDQFKDFELEFMEYIKSQESIALFSNKETISNKMKSALTKFYSKANLQKESCAVITSTLNKYSGEVRLYNFINFNYTSILENCLGTIEQGQINSRNYRDRKILDKVGSIVHIHGDKAQYPIIGLNDESQIANKDLANDEDFVCRIVKPLINKRLRNGNDATAEALINNSTIICVYGMSLGETDKKWWNLIIKWLNQSSERQLVIFDYDSGFKPSSQFDLLDKEDSIIKKLKKSNDNPQINVEKLLPRIHVAVHKNIFEMDLVKEYKENAINTINDTLEEFLSHV